MNKCVVGWEWCGIHTVPTDGGGGGRVLFFTQLKLEKQHALRNLHLVIIKMIAQQFLVFVSVVLWMRDVF